MNIWIFPDETPQFLITVGPENARALESLESLGPVFDTSLSSHEFAASLRRLVKDRSPTHGRFWSHWNEQPDVVKVATRIADALEARPDAPWNTSMSPPKR